MVKAVWRGHVIAESEDTVVVEGNHYFPPESVDKAYLRDSTTHTTCSWKGEASYYTLAKGDETSADAAWFYPAPKEAAANIEGYVAFWKDVDVS